MSETGTATKAANPTELLGQLRDEVRDAVAEMKSERAEIEKERKEAEKVLRELKSTSTSNGQQVAELEQKVTSALNQAGRSIQQARDEAVAGVEQTARQSAGAVAGVVTEQLEVANDRAEKLQATNARLEARQLWSAAAAMCLVLLPAATVVAGVWMSVAALVTGWGWVLEVGIGPWLHIGRGLVVVVGTAGALYAGYRTVRWVASLVGVWIGEGRPKWPSWRRRKK